MNGPLTILAVALTATLCSAQQATCGVSTPPTTTRTLIADINNDGYLDKLEIKDGILSVYYGQPEGGYQKRGAILLRNVQDAAVGNFRGGASQDIAVLFNNINLRQTALNLYINESGRFPAFEAIPVNTLDEFDSSCRLYSGMFSGTNHMDLAVVCPSQGMDLHVGTNNGDGTFRFHIFTTRDAQARVDQIVQQMLDTLRNHPPATVAKGQ